MAEVEKIAAVGPLYVSEAASEAVVKFSKAYSIDLGEEVEGDIPRRLEAANRCLEKARKEAERAKKSMLR